MKTEFDILCDLSNLENDNNSKKISCTVFVAMVIVE